MPAGEWNTVVECGAPWTRTLRYSDSERHPIALDPDAYCELRTYNDTLVARWDTDPGGGMSVEDNAVTIDLTDEDTAGIQAGAWRYDLWVQIAGEWERLVYGQIRVIAAISHRTEP